MANYRIYLHGRPQGQDIWSQNENSVDRFYLEPFLDSRAGSDAPSAMIVDFWQQHSYYTYVHCKNVVEKSLRPNAYFAITLCLDGVYCKNAGTLYNLFDQVYNKICVGSLISLENGQEHFMVSQFLEKLSTVEQINNLICQNVEKVILPFCVTFEKQKDTKDTTPKVYSLVDVDSPTFIADMQNARIVISSSYKSKDKLHEEVLQKIASQNAEISNDKAKIAQLQGRNEALENEKNLLTGKVSSLESQVKQLNNKVETIKRETEQQFKAEIVKKDQEIKDAKRKLDDNIAKYNSTIQSLQRENEKLRKETKIVSVDPEDLVRLMAERFPVLQKNQAPSSKWSRLFSKVFSWLSVVNFALLVVLLVILLCAKNDYSVLAQVDELKETNGQVLESKTINDNESTLGTEQRTIEITENRQEKPDYSTARIDIEGFNGGYELSKSYACNIKRVSVTNPSWKVEKGDASFDGNKLTVISGDTVTISCNDCDGKFIQERTIYKLK